MPGLQQSQRRRFVKQLVAGSIAAATVVPVFGRTAAVKRSLRIVHITDMHLDTRSVAIANVTKVLNEINALDDKPDLIINTGDSVFRADGRIYAEAKEQWELLAKVLSGHNRIPLKSCIGNHDVSFGPDEKSNSQYRANKLFHKKWALDVLDLPARYYTVAMNGWHFIALDSINSNDYSIDPEQFAWLSNELARIPAHDNVCIFSHVSILSIIPLLRSMKDTQLEDIRYPASRQHKDALQLKDLFYKYRNVKLCLSGHTHQVDELSFLGVKYLCGGAVSGNWWADDNRTSLVFDEFPPAYTIIDLFDDGSSHHKNVFYEFVA
jgi:3',5'-cyclic-AMP phosphodiesterase